MENEFDEIFKISTRDGLMVVDVENQGEEEKSLSADTVFEQSPEIMVSALMPLFLGSQILRALQESYASELASRMVAM
jgi:F-type H+-transporting ATPase subunit gamma